MNKQLGEMTMTATTPNKRGRRVAGAGLKAALAAMASLWLLPLQAANVLRDIQFTAAPNGSVEVSLQLDGPAGDAQVFTTDDPPRIAIDLPETTNQVAERKIAVGNGATSAITTLEANGRTRVVIDLFRPASFESRADGNRFVLSVGAGATSIAEAVAQSSAQSDPNKRIEAAAAVANLDFRRSESGGGRVIITMGDENFPADYADSGEGVAIQFASSQVPDSLVQRLDVTDFATPVQFIELKNGKNGATLKIDTNGQYEASAYQSGRDYVVEVSPIAPVAEGAGAIGVNGEEEEYVGTPVTFNFQNIPVRTVLQLIAEESGLNVVAADTISGNVTLRLINVPWDQALDIVLRAKGLDKRDDGNVVWVAPQSELAAYEQAKADARLALEQRAELITEYIPINYGNAEDIAKLLTEDSKRAGGSGGAQGGGTSSTSQGFLSPRGSVSFDRRTNTLLLNDSVEKVKEIKALIALLDRSVDQVLIEARIVLANESFARELGAQFGISAGYEDSNGNVLTTGGTIVATDTMANAALVNRFAGRGTGLPVASPGGIGQGVQSPSLADRLNVNLPVASPTGSIGFALLGADYLLDLELSALETEGRGEVVSSPRVITANQREAFVKQGDEIGFPVRQGTGADATTTVQFKEVLLELRVTPTITQDGRVSLIMSVKKDEVAGFTPTGEPNITKREISTAVLMDNAQTVVIGGVYEFSSREDLSKVPFLGDVPVLGNLFRNKGRNTEKAELLIFVTPKILKMQSSPVR